MAINGFFRPNLLVMAPKKKVPIAPPAFINEATQLASSIVILPVGNGDSSDLRIIRLGLVIPHHIAKYIFFSYEIEIKTSTFFDYNQIRNTHSLISD